MTDTYVLVHGAWHTGHELESIPIVQLRERIFMVWRARVPVADF
jgi:hypothetical protein